MNPFKHILASLALALGVLAAPFLPHSPVAQLAPSAQAQAMSDYLENKLIDHVFRGTSYTAPTVLAVALFTTACSDSAGGTEVSGGSYERASLSPSVSNWKSTNGTTSGASSGTGGQTSNASAITFPAPTGNWGTITHFGIYDNTTGGNLLICQALTASKNVSNGDAAPSFAIDALTVTFQ